MPAVLLAVLDQPARAASVLAAAGRMATLLGEATVAALAVVLPAAATILPSEEVLTDRHRAAWEADEAARLAALRHEYALWATDYPGPCEFRAESGDPATLVAEQGGRADLLVLPRPPADAPLPLPPTLHAALFDSGRPVMLVPPAGAGTFGRRVAIAWQADGRAERAVLWAIPLLRAAEAVHLLAAGDVAPDLPAVLREHAVAAQTHAVAASRHPGPALLAAAHDFGADLLVMGAYAHSPWREAVLGGVTSHILAAADLPVLLRH